MRVRKKEIETKKYGRNERVLGFLPQSFPPLSNFPLLLARGKNRRRMTEQKAALLPALMKLSVGARGSRLDKTAARRR